jgi:hypothetical protein
MRKAQYVVVALAIAFVVASGIAALTTIRQVRMEASSFSQPPARI